MPHCSYWRTCTPFVAAQSPEAGAAGSDDDVAEGDGAKRRLRPADAPQKPGKRDFHHAFGKPHGTAENERGQEQQQSHGAAWGSPQVACHALKPWPWPHQAPGSSGTSSPAKGLSGSGMRLASTLSMRLPSRSTTSRRQFSQVAMSPVWGRRPSSHITMPLRVW